MRKAFSSQTGETSLVRDALVQNDIAATIQNEHSGRSAVPAFPLPAQVWINDDGEYENARRIVGETIAKLDVAAAAASRVCASCGEENPQSFDVCSSCGADGLGGRD